MYLSVLHENPNLNNLKDNMSRLNVITTDVFQVFNFNNKEATRKVEYNLKSTRHILNCVLKGKTSVSTFKRHYHTDAVAIPMQYNAREVCLQNKYGRVNYSFKAPINEDEI
jgi:hypothetical protein